MKKAHKRPVATERQATPPPRGTDLPPLVLMKGWTPCDVLRHLLEREATH